MPYRISQLYNVREYHQPTDLDEALTLIRRRDITSVPVAGGVTVAGKDQPMSRHWSISVG